MRRGLCGRKCGGGKVAGGRRLLDWGNCLFVFADAIRGTTRGCLYLNRGLLSVEISV